MDKSPLFTVRGKGKKTPLFTSSSRQKQASPYPRPSKEDSLSKWKHDLFPSNNTHLSIAISNLDPKCSANDLVKVFEQFGNIETVEFAAKKSIIKFDSNAAVRRAINKFDNQIVDGRLLSVKSISQTPQLTIAGASSSSLSIAGASFSSTHSGRSSFGNGGFGGSSCATFGGNSSSSFGGGLVGNSFKPRSLNSSFSSSGNTGKMYSDKIAPAIIQKPHHPTVHFDVRSINRLIENPNNSDRPRLNRSVRVVEPTFTVTL